jgi:RecJ-like exonuclease
VTVRPVPETNGIPSQSAPEAAPVDSVVGEEDPGAAVDMQPGGRREEAPIVSDETGRAPCAKCAGTGRTELDEVCPVCDGVGTVLVKDAAA